MGDLLEAIIRVLCVLGAMAILCTIAVPVMQQVDERSKDRADQALVLVYNQAMESYRFNDYSTLSLVANKKVMFEENGRVKINAELNMDSDDIAALANSGKGIYPQSKEECIAIIKLYTGTESEIDYPSKGVLYDFYYNKNTGKVSVLRETDIPVGLRSQYINLSGG